MRLTRRRLLSAAAATAGTSLFTGCIGDGETAGSEESGATTAQASFFVFGDIADRVAGDAATADLLVPVGQHGHGWEPGPSVREDVHDADLFVHGMTGFQPWVDDVRTDLEVDAPDVTTVDVSAGLDLIEAGEGHDHGAEEDDEEHTDEQHDEEHHDEDHTDEHHDEDAEEHTDHEEEGDQEAEHDENHGQGIDPHFWMDPLRVKQATGNVRQGLADVDPNNEEAYAENVAAFRDDLDDLHEQFEELAAAASKEVILVAGHNSVRYFGDRYGIAVEALTNVSPDDRPTQRDVERAQDVIETHDLRYICADPLESQQAVNRLVEETDVEEVLPLTAMPGLTDEWEREDWGYVEVMENVNLPTLERALEVR